jgi:hypothetical protein
MFRLLFLVLSIACLAPADLPARIKDRLWQEGELTFRKTVIPTHNQRPQYVYRVRGSGGRYLVRLDEPLTVSLFSSITFSISKRHLFIKDEDGSERKAAIVRRNAPRFPIH